MASRDRGAVVVRKLLVNAGWPLGSLLFALALCGCFSGEIAEHWQTGDGASGTIVEDGSVPNRPPHRRDGGADENPDAADPTTPDAGQDSEPRRDEPDAGPEPEAEVPAVDQCLHADDVAVLESEDLTSASESCIGPCLGQSDVRGCLSPCIQSLTALGRDCARCFASLVTCTLDTCSGECSSGTLTAECRQCQREEGCVGMYLECSGLEGVTCLSDLNCDSGCPGFGDPDCECECDSTEDICEAGGRDSADACSCDWDCAATSEPCGSDGHCDSWCFVGTDPDCPCTCDFNDSCEALEAGSAETCPCDDDCPSGTEACSADGHCDGFCPEGTDRDCVTCDCDYFMDVCESTTDATKIECECDFDCHGEAEACDADGHCDTYCDPLGMCEDPDCSGSEGSGYLTGTCARS